MPTSLQVLLWMSLALGCLSHPPTEKAGLSTTSTLKTPTSSSAAPVSKHPASPNATHGSEKIKPSPETMSNESEETGISHIIKHSKLFTEFVSFAVNPVKSMELVDSIKSGILADTAEIQQTQANETSSESVTGQVESNSFLQELFVEMTKVNSPGFVVSFDYLNVTAKSSDGEKMFRKPVRMWGILPDELNNKTVYFLADHYRAASVDVETKSSAKEQVEDFESWKNETLSSDAFSDDKLGDGAIGSLVGSDKFLSSESTDEDLDAFTIGNRFGGSSSGVQLDPGTIGSLTGGDAQSSDEFTDDKLGDITIAILVGKGG